MGTLTLLGKARSSPCKASVGSASCLVARRQKLDVPHEVRGGAGAELFPEGLYGEVSSPSCMPRPSERRRDSAVVRRSLL